MKFTLEIESGNAAFTDYLQPEVARILRELADQIVRGSYGGTVRDINGNSVGTFTLEADDDADD